MQLHGTCQEKSLGLKLINELLIFFQGSLEDYNETVKCAKEAWKYWAMVLK